MTTATNGTHEEGADSRFGGLAAVVEKSIASSIDQNLGSLATDFPVTRQDLSILGGERTRAALIGLLKKGVKDTSKGGDVEQPSSMRKMQMDVLMLIDKMLEAESKGPAKEHSNEEVEANKNADIAANVLTSVLLKSSPEIGIDPREVESRRAAFGSNAILDKPIESFCSLCYEAVQDFVLCMLIVLGTIGIVVETTVGTDPGEKCGPCWAEGAAILISVIIVVNITASIDYAKQFAFIRLTRSLNDTNTKQVIRDGKQVSVTDDEIVVGDILSVNSHSQASIPADCVVLGPAADLKIDESTLTGESKAVVKRPGDVVLSGTTAIQGSGRMVVIAVGVNSVAGKIKARVYEAVDAEGLDDLEGGDANSPLFFKLDKIARQIGFAGTCAACVAFAASCIIGLGVNKEPLSKIVHYLVVAITVLAVAVPEGLPLAVTLSLAFSSNQMMKDHNLVKHLDACETMGCATTICTDKTGTLTANKMSVRAFYAGSVNYVPEDPKVTLGAFVKSKGAPAELLDIFSKVVAIDTMNETLLYFDDKKVLTGGSGNPTEVALLAFTHDLGINYETIRNTTRGRSSAGALGEYLSEGKLYGFSSARKMMSWAVPLPGGGFRLYTKGAQEVLLGRCDRYYGISGEDDMTDDVKNKFNEVALAYARRGMRCIALAYADLPEGFDLEKLSATVKNSDGTEACESETNLCAVALVGIEDPLRFEVPPAIARCYDAGIDVRMVTGDNPNTAVSIAYQAGILRDFHFKEGTTERVADNLKENVLMVGADFRARVYRSGGNKDFDQATFDKIWPFLRVLARSSPDDKLTLAHGLNQSTLYTDKEYCAKLLKEEGITIFPDRQVVAMTGDGTNDAPALKRADIGFAMGISGTQIAKDAADIILMDDNFASIVTAAKWGRNVYASIQKFLQFQLTVNIAAVVTALIGAFAYQTSPLAAIQLLWVNLLMDSLASLALASEPPKEELLDKPPVNRTQPMITKRMWCNMLGHASYQIFVVLFLLFRAPAIFDIEPGHEAEDRDENSVHYTLIFNSFVWMQLFNEVNSRNLKGEFNVFGGIHKNAIFCSILFITSCLQVLIVEKGHFAFHVAEGGLDMKYWGISIAIGAGALPVQQVINLAFMIGQQFTGSRNKGRLVKNGALSTKKANASGHSHVE